MAPENSPASTSVITEIAPQKNATDRYSIFLDGNFAFGLGAEVVLEFGLHTGMTITADRIAEIRRREEIVKATNAGLNLLAYRARSTGELETRLRQKGFPPDIIEIAIERFRNWGYLDDRSFAESWVENQQAHRPRSRRVLKQELQQKGIPRDLIETTMESTTIDEAADALELARKQWGKLSSQPPDVRQRRLSGYLARRGYQYDIIRKVIETLNSEDAGSSPPEPPA